MRVPRWGWGGAYPKSDTNPLTKAKHLYYINPQARLPTSALIKEKDLGVPSVTLAFIGPIVTERYATARPPARASSPAPFHPPSFTSTPPLQALPKGPTPTPSQRSITRPVPCMEGPRTNHGTPFPRATAKCAPHSPGASVSPPQATPRSTAS